MRACVCVCIHHRGNMRMCVLACAQDAKIEPEEFTSRLQAELKSSPQPYLIPFLKVVIVLPNPEPITRSSWRRIISRQSLTLECFAPSEKSSRLASVTSQQPAVADHAPRLQLCPAHERRHPTALACRNARRPDERTARHRNGGGERFALSSHVFFFLIKPK